MTDTIQKRFNINDAISALSIQPHTFNVNRYTPKQNPDDTRVFLRYTAEFNITGRSMTALGALAGQIIKEMAGQCLYVEDFKIEHGRFNFAEDDRLFSLTKTTEATGTLIVVFKTPDQIAQRKATDAEWLEAVRDMFARKTDA